MKIAVASKTQLNTMNRTLSVTKRTLSFGSRKGAALKTGVSLSEKDLTEYMEKELDLQKVLSKSEQKRWRRMSLQKKKRIFEKVSYSSAVRSLAEKMRKSNPNAEIREFVKRGSALENAVPGHYAEEHFAKQSDAHSIKSLEGQAVSGQVVRGLEQRLGKEIEESAGQEVRATMNSGETRIAANSKKVVVRINASEKYSDRSITGKELKKELKNAETDRLQVSEPAASVRTSSRSDTLHSAASATQKFTVIRYAKRVTGKIVRAVKQAAARTNQSTSEYSAKADLRRPDTARQNIYNGIGKMFRAFAALIGMIFAAVLLPILLVLLIIVILVSIIVALVFAVIDFFSAETVPLFTGNLTYVEKALEMAEDPRFGYNTYYRTGEVRQNSSGEDCQDYDNTSFIAYVLREAAYDVSWFTARSADAALQEVNFQELDYSGPEDLLRGDVLMRADTDENGRTHKYYEIYAGDGNIVGAVEDENGGDGQSLDRRGSTVYAEPGDQNGREIRKAPISGEWEKIYRPPQAALDSNVFVNDAPEMFQYFYTRGYSIEQICALLGNFMAESSCTFRNVSIGEMRLHGNEVLEYYGLLGLSNADAVTLFFNNANTGNMSRNQFVNPPHRFGVGFFMATTPSVKAVLWDRTIGEGINLDTGSGQLEAFMEIHARQMEELKTYTSLEECTEYVLTCIEMAMPSIHDSWTPTRGMPSKEECMVDRLSYANAFLTSFRSTSAVPNSSDEYNGTSNIPYIQLAIEIANHDIHQYGWGATGEHSAGADYGNFDCSHYVVYCLQHGGYPQLSYGSTSDHADYYSPLRDQIGWNEYDFGSVPLQEGDVVWKNGHIEFYVGSGMTIGAHDHYSEDPAKDISVVNCRDDYQKVYRDPALDR